MMAQELLTNIMIDDQTGNWSDLAKSTLYAIRTMQLKSNNTFFRAYETHTPHKTNWVKDQAPDWGQDAMEATHEDECHSDQDCLKWSLMNQILDSSNAFDSPVHPLQCLQSLQSQQVQPQQLSSQSDTNETPQWLHTQPHDHNCEQQQNTPR